MRNRYSLRNRLQGSQRSQGRRDDDDIMDPRTSLRILNQEMTNKGWTKQMKNDFLQISPRGEEFAIKVSPSQRRFNVPVFSPFIDLTPLTAYDLCESQMKALYDFLKQGKYKWCKQKSFSAFLSVMKILQLRAGPQEECYKLPAVILYKEVVRQLNLSTPVQIQYFDGKEFDSASAHDLKLEEAYAVVEFIGLTGQMNHRAVTGRYDSYAHYNQTYIRHLKAAVQLRDVTEKALHVRIVGLEPKADDSDDEDAAQNSANDDSDDDEELELIDYFSLRHPKTVAAKPQPAVPAKESLVTKEEKDDDTKLMAASVLSENNKSNVPDSVAAKPKLSKEKESAPANLPANKLVRESDPASAESDLNKTESREANGKKATDIRDELNASGFNTSASKDKDLKQGVRAESEKENHPDADDGSVYNPSRSNSNQKSDPPGKRMFGNQAVLSPEEESLGTEPAPELRKAATSIDMVDAPFLYANKQVPSDMLDSCLEKPVLPALPDEKILPDSVFELQKKVEALRAKNEKVIANLRNKKALLEEATKKNKRLEDELNQERNLHTQIASLRTGIENLTATRDNLRNKLRIEKELHTQARLEKEKAQRQLKQTEKLRSAELELLDLYREFGNHSGFHGWGKRIRKLEAEVLEQQNSLAGQI
ncbi:hypothetical protein FisN_19Hh011 [Fistulifera solaris]|uniref:Uncharacterized protein n=1 Tax=Fistulifera solaris TaxID=1519565 RepID=A0A1Z5JZI7_FISSO|nr:hypothetical protein FisN_19Hh011 [Fistulifera solaris]|eukprot:GAX19440.1 hypothetical protein FisN_19Hh011 [Fistulifera solaris]